MKVIAELLSHLAHFLISVYCIGFKKPSKVNRNEAFRTKIYQNTKIESTFETRDSVNAKLPGYYFLFKQSEFGLFENMNLHIHTNMHPILK